MQKRNALLCGATFGVLLVAGIGAAAQAAPRHHHHAAAAADGSATQEKIDSLTAAVSTLEQRLNDEAAARQADEARAQAAEAKADSAEADAQATRTQLQEQIQTIPSDVQTAVASIKPKTDAIYYKGITLTPGGFLEAAGIYRSKSEDSDLASNFAKIPLGNNAVGHTQELRGSARQSRISLLAQGKINDDTLAAFYIETDFLGAAQTANSNSTNSFNLRIRNVYGTLDWNAPGWHLLAGQNWSLATMNTKGITPRNELPPPSIDAQYVPGFAFARQPQLRLTKDFDDKQVWLAVSVENPQTTFSGSTAAGVNAFTGATGSTLITSASAGQSASSGFTNINTFSLNHVPDVIGKIAVEPNIGGARPVHLELFGLYRDYYDRVNTGANNFGFPVGITNSDASGGGIGGGVTVNVVPKLLDVEGSFLTGTGIGRYGAAGLPDATLQPNGKIVPIPETMFLAGATLHATPSLDIYVFGGQEAENAKPFNVTTITGTPATSHLGYGNPFLSNAGCLSEAETNVAALTCTGTVKSVDQITAGFWDKIYSGAFGYVRVGVQYSHTDLNTFAGENSAGRVGSLAPKTSDDMIFTSFRYYPF
jgi:hypothetical protein